MTKTNLIGVKVRQITQVALVVEDLQQVVSDYWNILGIGPWKIYLSEPPTAYERNYHDTPSWGREKMAITKLGAIQLKLIQPIEGNSIYKDHLSSHGEGIHYIQFLVDDVSEAAKILNDEGYKSLQDERIGELKYYYFEIEPLHCVCKLGTVSDIVHQGNTLYPQIFQESPAKVVVKNISQIALAVEDVRSTLEHYWNILGIGPWDVVTALPPALYDTTYHGIPSNYTFRIALCQLGATQLELMQPLSGKSVHADVLKEQGQGLHHMQLQVHDINETTRLMKRAGFDTLASGGYSGGGYAFYDTTKRLKCVWEVLQAPEQISVDYRWPKEL